MAPAAVELQRAEKLRLRAGDVDRVEHPVRDREERLAVRLDDVRLVDARLLDVRAGVVDALLRRRIRCCRRPIGGARGRGRHGRSRRHGHSLARNANREGAAEAIGADVLGRVRLRVVEQVGAGAEGDEPSGLASVPAWAVPPSAAAARTASATTSRTLRRETIMLVIRRRSAACVTVGRNLYE